ncbi:MULTISPECIES: hypothetical protein [unclassified Polaribacter]|uniref:hypothetical protein n=1 Tax=unclassified Polaribacter TaxID=196858 RepID=UPI00167BF6F3|nr:MULTISPECIES: hypothetical protein [unclassified Polaribacter]
MNNEDLQDLQGFGNLAGRQQESNIESNNTNKVLKALQDETESLQDKSETLQE